MAYIPPSFPERDVITLANTPAGTAAILANFGCCISIEQLIVIITYLCGQQLALGGTAAQALAASNAPASDDIRQLMAYAAGLAQGAGADSGETGNELWVLAQYYGYNSLTQPERLRIILGAVCAYIIACEP